MRVLTLYLALTSLAAAQEARELLERIAAHAAAAGSWQLTGRTVTSLTVGSSRSTQDVVFHSVWERPGRLRYQIAGGRLAGLLACDATGGWTTVPRRPTEKIPAPTQCPASPTNWETLTTGLLSAQIQGTGTALVEGRDQPCERISARYSAVRGLAPGKLNQVWNGSFQRNLCIDRDRLLVLRDEIEGTPAAFEAGASTIRQVTTYALIQRNARLDPAIFESDLPPFPPVPATPLLRPLPPAGSTPPELFYRRQPEYTAEARARKYQGTAVIEILVGADGVPREPRVIAPLGYGLDRKALEALCDWRFHPARENGRPVARRATVELAFRLSGD